MIVSEYAKRSKSTAVTLRFTYIYGPGQKHSNQIEGFMTRAMSGLPIELYGDGSHTREFLFIEDAVDSVIAAVRAELLSDAFVISSGEPVSMSELAEKISSMIDRVCIRRLNSHKILSQRYDISRAQTCLGWTPRVSLDKGLALMLGWLAEA
jgi:nucleoside-diphosphate-sugar epimerase